MSAANKGLARKTPRSVGQVSSLQAVALLPEGREPAPELVSELCGCLDQMALELDGLIQLLAACEPGSVISTAALRAMMESPWSQLLQAQGCAQQLRPLPKRPTEPNKQKSE